MNTPDKPDSDEAEIEQLYQEYEDFARNLRFCLYSHNKPMITEINVLMGVHTPLIKYALGSFRNVPAEFVRTEGPPALQQLDPADSSAVLLFTLSDNKFRLKEDESNIADFEALCCIIDLIVRRKKAVL